MVEFGGWDMPVEYAGLVQEHMAVRSAAGLFDVSHMGEIEIAGKDALRAVQHITCNDAGEKHLAIISCLGEERFNLAYPVDSATFIPLPRGGKIWLRADVNYAKLRFSWSLDGERWTSHEGVLDYSLISDEAGRGYTKSFTGAFVGMACHDISGRRQPADFEFFEYVEHEDIAPRSAVK